MNVCRKNTKGAVKVLSAIHISHLSSKQLTCKNPKPSILFQDNRLLLWYRIHHDYRCTLILDTSPHSIGWGRFSKLSNKTFHSIWCWSMSWLLFGTSRILLINIPNILIEYLCREQCKIQQDENVWISKFVCGTTLGDIFFDSNFLSAFSS